jgi:hypothetical protein
MSPSTRKKVYTAVGAVTGLLVVAGVVNADEIDVEAVTNAVVQIAAVASLLLARANVKDA